MKTEGAIEKEKNNQWELWFQKVIKEEIQKNYVTHMLEI